ncbi:MAG TPA: hypothetical protein VML55_24015, partial [Planctomycetaceae bacterium]|nr:hypothetical protein [Planctomycetaceae bacterium]
MFRLASTTLAAVLTAAVQPDALLAQVPSPRVSTVVESADELYRQLDYVMGLTTPQEQQQTKNLKEHFDVFLIGVSRDKPGRMDLLIDAEKFRYLLAVPVTAANLNNFRANNLTPLGLDNRRIALTLYRFHNKVWNGFMRFANDYALFGERKEDVPPNVPDPTLAIAGVLKQGYHAAFDLEVQNPAPMSQQERRDNFNHPDGIREVML